ncbi:unnamed protein product [Leptidea sinapis]|uniref:Uncharacterized protein n=1 Tax=Leptidea sinapis TaxID=189913 RepID=A0A5E4QC64_9NEOP|nr:unnamed protein product [Leptidea sinapis]
MQNSHYNIPISNTTIRSETTENLVQEQLLAPGPAPQGPPDFYLQRPGAAANPHPVESRLLKLGHVGTSLKDPKVPRANPDNLKRLELLQKFGDSSWKDVRYTDALKLHNASPGFVNLEVNDELRQFVKGKDHTANSERIIAAMCNGLITQRELLNQILQDFVNWTVSTDTILSAESFTQGNNISQGNSGDPWYSQLCQLRNTKRKTALPPVATSCSNSSETTSSYTIDNSDPSSKRLKMVDNYHEELPCSKQLTPDVDTPLFDN